MFSAITSLLSGLVSPVTNLIGKVQDRKKAAETLQGKIAMAKQQGEQSITVTDAEWENLAVNKIDSSWKDEYVTIIITFPLVGILGGALWLAFTGDARLLDGIKAGIAELQALGMDYGTLLKAVVLAALGLKLWRSK